MKKSYILAVCAGLMLATSSCDDFLTEMPENSYTLENSVTDYKSAQNSVNGIYGVYAKSTYLGGYLYGFTHCMAGMWDYSPEMVNMGYKQSTSNSSISSMWSGLYSTVNAANAAIEGISKLPDDKFPSAEAKTRLLAEARCFRGYANLHLMWFFARWFDPADSPYGIIYRDKTAELSNLMVGRRTVGDSYALILDDLKYAEDNLGDYTSGKYMSKQLAKAMHAKLLMVRNWDGDYAEALTLVNDVLDHTPAGLGMESDITKLYEDAWDSKEVLFSRYIADMSNLSYLEFIYSYGLYFNPKFTDIVQEWLEADERYPYITGNARSPETWQDERKDNILTKLYHRGRYEGMDDKYTSYNLRYAELYLMKAELLARTNPSDINGALAELNKMRQSYTNPVLAPVTGINNHQELMDAIFKEYVVTLIMENETPWFASLRFEHDGKPWIRTLKPDVDFSENQYCWPIPDAEIIAHSNKIDQNPGLE